MAIQSPALDLPASASVKATKASSARGYWQTVGRRLRRDPVTLICAGVLLLIVTAALAAPWLGLADPYKTSMIYRLKPIGTPRFFLGSDELGRDMLARLIYGGRLSLFMGVTPVVCALMIGGLVPTFRRYLSALYQAEGQRQSDLVETIHGMRAVKSLARPSGEFDASRYFRGERNFAFLNTGTVPMRRLARSIGVAEAPVQRR